MSVIFADHLDGPNATDLSTVNTTYNQRGLSGTGTTLQFDTSTFAAGTSSAKAVQGTSFASANMYTAPYTSTANLYTRLCLRLGSLPTGGTLYVCQNLSSSAAITSRLAVTSAGKLAVYDATTLVSTGTTTLSVNTWYRIEWDIVGTASTIRLYGSPTSTTVLETISSTLTGTAMVRSQDGIPASGNSNLVTLWWDEVVRDGTTAPGAVGGIAASSTGSGVFVGRSTSALGASSHGTLVALGSSQPLTAGGPISGFSDNFAGIAVDPSKWQSLQSAAQNSAAILPCTNPASTLLSSKYYDGTTSSVFIGFQAPASGTGDLTFTLLNRADPTKYAQFKVSGGNITMTVLDGGADAGVVTRAVTVNDHVVRFTESAGSVIAEVRPRNSTSWSTLRTFTTPSWWNALRVQLGGFSSSASTASAVFSHLNLTPAAPTGNVLSSTLTDDFSGTSLDGTKWFVSGPGAVAVSNDVEITAQSTLTQVTSVNEYALDVANLQVKAAHGALTDRTTFKILGESTGTEARLTLTNNQLLAEYRIGDIADAYTATVTYDNSQTVYLQFLVDNLNNNLVWSYSVDGTNYAVLRTTRLPVWTSGVKFAYAAKTL